MLPIKELIDHNIDARRFKYPTDNCHHINSTCSIALFQYGDGHPKAAMVYLRSREHRLFSFSTLLFEDENQRRVWKEHKPDLTNERPLRIGKPREIFKIARSPEGYSYSGVKKVKS